MSPKKNIKVKSKASKAKRCSTKFPVEHIKRMFKEGQYANSLTPTAPVYLSAVLEYMAAEVLGLAGKLAKNRKKKRITPTDINTALRADKELSELCPDVVIPGARAAPNLNER